MSVVVDASLTLSWYFEDEQTAERLSVLDRVAEHSAMVPPLWAFEIANTFAIAERRARVNQAFVDHAVAHLRCLPISVDAKGFERLWVSTYRIALRYGLTVYDASYLELAERLQFPLASLDKALCKAAAAAGIETLAL